MTYYYSVVFQAGDFYKTYAVLILTPRQLQIHSKCKTTPLFSALLEYCDASMSSGGLKLNNYSHECLLRFEDAAPLYKSIKNASLPPRQRLRFNCELKSYQIQVEDREIVLTGSESYYQRIGLTDCSMNICRNVITLTYQNQQRDLEFPTAGDAQDVVDIVYIARNLPKYLTRIDQQQSKLRQTQFLRTRQQESFDMSTDQRQATTLNSSCRQMRLQKTVAEMEQDGSAFEEPDESTAPLPQRKPFSIPFVERMQNQQSMESVIPQNTSHYQWKRDEQAKEQLPSGFDLDHNTQNEEQKSDEATPEIELVDYYAKQPSTQGQQHIQNITQTEAYDAATLYRVDQSVPKMVLSQSDRPHNIYEEALAGTPGKPAQSEKQAQKTIFDDIDAFNANQNGHAGSPNGNWESVQRTPPNEGYDYNLQAALNTLEGQFVAVLGRQQVQIGFKLIGTSLIVQFVRFCQVKRSMRLACIEELQRNAQYVNFAMRDEKANFVSLIIQRDQYDLMVPAVETVLKWIMSRVSIV